MVDELKCPFCGEELEYWNESTYQVLGCHCGPFPPLTGNERMWRALIQSQRDLQIAIRALREIRYGKDAVDLPAQTPWEIIADKALKQIDHSEVESKMNRIIEITEINDYKRNSDYYGGYDGYKIKTEQDEYLFLINNGQNCCEDWGYLSTPDELSDYIGADLLSVKRVTINDCAKDENLKDKMEYKYDPANTMFVNIETSNGLLQFAAYNQHNGYYGHNVMLLKNGEVIEEDCL